MDELKNVLGMNRTSRAARRDYANGNDGDFGGGDGGEDEPEPVSARCGSPRSVRAAAVPATPAKFARFQINRPPTPATVPRAAAESAREEPAAAAGGGGAPPLPPPARVSAAEAPRIAKHVAERDLKRSATTAAFRAAVAGQPTMAIENDDYPDSALCVKPEWLEKILRREKTVELRGTKSNKDGVRVGLICSGTGLVCGECVFGDCEGPLDGSRLLELQPRHRVYARSDGAPDTPAELRARISYRNCYAWSLADARVYERPRPYEHPRGAIGFVDLTRALAGHARAGTRPAPRRPKSPVPSGGAPAARKKPPRGPGRSRKCGSCDGCLAAECGTCAHCKDKAKFGGPNKIKRACVRRVCANPTRPAGTDVAGGPPPVAVDPC